MTPSAVSLAREIRLLILDVDGVLTDGSLQFDNRGEEYKIFNSLDGHGIRMLQHYGIEVGVITGRHSKALEYRMDDLEIKHVYQGCKDKPRPHHPAEVGWPANHIARLQVVMTIAVHCALHRRQLGPRYRLGISRRARRKKNVDHVIRSREKR